MRVLAFLLLLLPLAACSAPSPTLRVDRVGITERTPSGIVLSISLRAENPGKDPLPLRDIRYHVNVNGRRVFEGVRSAQATVRSFGAEEITVPAVIPLSGHEPAPVGVQPVSVGGRVLYLAPGTLAETLFEAELLRPSASFSGETTVDFSVVPPTP